MGTMMVITGICLIEDIAEKVLIKCGNKDGATNVRTVTYFLLLIINLMLMKDLMSAGYSLYNGAETPLNGTFFNGLEEALGDKFMDLIGR